MKNKSGIVWIALGLVFLLSAGGITGYWLFRECRAEKVSRTVLLRMESLLPEETEPAEDLPPDIDLATLPMPEITVEESAYIGILEFPSLSLSLPVLRDYSPEGMDITPCRYSGSAYADNLVIVGHNYRAHFRDLKKLSPGDAVNFCDAEGKVFSYRVTGIEVISPDRPDLLCEGNWDLTLMTCTVDGSSRLLLRCEKSS